MTTVQLNLHDRRRPSFMVTASLERVPVLGEVIDHEGVSYEVSTVVFHTNGRMPYIVAKVRL